MTKNSTQIEVESNDIPIVCTPEAMSSEQRERYPIIQGIVWKKMIGYEERDYGYSIQFPKDHLVHVAELVSLELLCCPFLSYSLEIPLGSESLNLVMSGGIGVKEFLQQELGLE